MYTLTIYKVSLVLITKIYYNNGSNVNKCSKCQTVDPTAYRDISEAKKLSW